MEDIAGAKDARSIVFVAHMKGYPDVVAYIADREENTLHGLKPVWIRRGKPSQREDLGAFARSVFGPTVTKVNKSTYHVTIASMPERVITLKLKKRQNGEPKKFPGRVVAYVEGEDGKADLILREVVSEVQKAPPDLKKMTAVCESKKTGERIEREIVVTPDMKSKFDISQMAFA